jgi:Protein of unknown function (DUF3606)
MNEINIENETIEVQCAADLTIWQALLKCSKADLMEAICQVGNNTAKVRKYLSEDKFNPTHI